MGSLLVKNARIGGSFNFGGQKQDIFIADGLIQEIAPKLKVSSSTVLDAEGLLVSPGLIDIHAHVAPGISLSVNPDEAGVRAGACTVCDAGSLGWSNYEKGRRILEDQARQGQSKTDVLHFMHIAPDGEVVLPETGYEKLDEAKIENLISNNRQKIIGIKARAVSSALAFEQYDVFQKAAEIAHRHHIPLMVHLGDRDAGSAEEMYRFTKKLLGFLEAGDILTHIFTPAPGGILQDGKLLEDVREAVAKGVLLDLSPGMGHTSFANLRAGLDLGLKPHLFGTDVVRLQGWKKIMVPHFYNLCVIASKLIALGLELDETLDMLTINAARAIGLQEEIGTIKIGKKADLTLIKIIEVPAVFHDGGMGTLIRGNLLLSPRKVIKGGEVIKVSKKISGHRTDRGFFKILAEKTGKELDG